jgi:hypothetical protein
MWRLEGGEWENLCLFTQILKTNIFNINILSNIINNNVFLSMGTPQKVYPHQIYRLTIATLN